MLLLIDLCAVVALCIFTGNSGILTVGHVGFFAVGAYATGLLTTPPDLKSDMLRHLPGFLAQIELSLPASLIVVAAISLVLGIVTGLPLSRLRETSAILATFGLLVITDYLLKGATNLTNGTKGFYGVPQIVSLPIVYFFVFLALAIAFAFKESHWGLQLRAFQDNEVAAAATGIESNQRLLQGWTVSAMVMGVTGALFAHIIGAFQPHDFYLDMTFALIAMLVVGGKRSISGAVIGTIIVTALVELVRPFESGVSIGSFRSPPIWGATQILLSLMILLVMYKRPAGIMGSQELALDRLWRRVPKIGAQPQAGGPETPMSSRHGAKMLRAEGLGVDFGGLRALNNVSIKVQSGQIVGLIGPNGAGKTTLINGLTGVHHPNHGTVLLGDRNVVGWRPSRIARAGLARTFQNIRLFGEMTVIENVMAAAAARGHGAAGIEDYAKGLLAQFDLLDDAERVASTLAYGNQRRLEIARALALEPSFLLLDEPAAGMNPKESEQLIAAILDIRNKYGLGILIVEHDLHLIMRLCDQVFVLNKGELIASGSAAQVQNDPQVIEAYLGTRDLLAKRKVRQETEISNNKGEGNV
ncbi:MAG: branched-chain amino acid ABC transporter ATP-binding protein/permease [Mesorhizobium sp.]|uniref:branched-chain amino acid ABC transporter ATP-binding protein/permease n=1 Tax=Mesorhizobium sp. TaxID=1871066 RepID=UPI001AC461EF|nr:branched-chain amino acid ABC transporter ATP-binding protein/permease [Mesorhizobium sp.]MBN9223109.1 branched-chain amino acid ABC transporter ATP-binding protein/permease [Mesorhizobium sp.]